MFLRGKLTLIELTFIVFALGQFREVGLQLPASGQGVVFVVVSPFPGKRLQTAKNIFKTNSSLHNLEKAPKWNRKKIHDDATFCFFLG